MGNPDQKPDLKVGKLFFLFVVMGVIALPIIIFQAFSVNPPEVQAEVNIVLASDFDHNAKQLYQAFDETTPAYMEGAATARTLSYYYSLRQYIGSPPYIPHEDLVGATGGEKECLSCHERGGFVQVRNRFTPVTPHPQHTACRQCHMRKAVETQFQGIDWVSVQPPGLGRSELPGSPPPIAHSLQMRENCIACHVGPGTVVPIRVEHPMRGNCRQCHIPAQTQALFTRNPK